MYYTGLFPKSTKCTQVFVSEPTSEETQTKKAITKTKYYYPLLKIEPVVGKWIWFFF
jgi:hypothetical protein